MLVTRELKMCRRPSEVVANTNLTLAPIGVSPMAENLKKLFLNALKFKFTYCIIKYLEPMLISAE